MEERKPRKLLIASIGVAAATYVACVHETSGNLAAPLPVDSGTVDVGADTSDDTGVEDASKDATDDG